MSARYQVDLLVEFEDDSDADVIYDLVVDLLDGTPSSGDRMPPGFTAWIEGVARLEPYDAQGD